MSIFYVVFSAIDAITLILGDLVSSKHNWFLCANDVFLLPSNDAGCAFLMLDGIIFLAFSYNISHIFFKLPDKHGLLVKRL
jgi:hypothetical protein